jgi:hypothetical protein
MTGQQGDTIKEYENEVRKRGGNAILDWRESNSPESRGILFADANGVTLMIYSDGLINIPAVRSWDPKKHYHVTAAACAKELWLRQKIRDDADRNTAKQRHTGHLDSIVGFDLKCRDIECPCQNPEERQKRARGGRNTSKRDARDEEFRNSRGCP